MNSNSIFFKTCFVVLLLSMQIHTFSQTISGKITNEKGEPLPYSSVIVKGTTIGTTANQSAQYEFMLKPGKYILVCQHIGFASSEQSIDINKNTTLNFVLQEQKMLMNEIVITSGENPANEIIRQAIKKRSFFNSQVNEYQCNLYTKDLIKLRNLPNKIFGQKLKDEDKKSMRLDSTNKGIIYLSEALSKISYRNPDKLKLEVISSRVSGSNSFGFTFPAFINFYTNNVDVFNGGFNSRGFVSPIADGAFRFYKYKMMGSFVENGKTINTIKVIPKRMNEPLFSGIINIVDEDWHLQSVDLMLTKQNQLDLLDTLKITQLFVPVTDEIWKTKHQLLFFNFKMFGIDVVANFLSVYADYKINPVFAKGFFDKVVIKYDSAVDKKSKNYWDTIRPVPLEKEEILDYHIKDSINQVEIDASKSQSYIDTLKKKQGKLNPLKIIFPGINRTIYKTTGKSYWGIEPLLLNTNFNTAEGLNMQANIYYRNKITKKIKFYIAPKFRYGFENHHFNSWVDMNFQTKDSNKSNINNWFISLGKKVSQYNNNNPVDPLLNTLTTLTEGNNLMKIYEKKYVGLGYEKSMENGLKFLIKTSYEDRIPIFNTTNYTIQAKDSIHITENYPVEKINRDEVVNHQALLATVEFTYKPGLQFIQFPKGKMPLGSKYPTLQLKYTKGFKQLLGSDVDFDKWNFNVYDDLDLKLVGAVKYKFSVGGFLNKRAIYFQDYKHFNGNSVGISASMNDFNLIKSYQYSTATNFYSEAHIEHHFNGLITNKIPLIKKLKWNLVTGLNAFYINNSNQYAEIAVGLENIFKIFRVDFVSSFDHQRFVKSSIVLGLGGALGSSVSNNNDANNNNSILNF